LVVRKFTNIIQNEKRRRPPLSRGPSSVLLKTYKLLREVVNPARLAIGIGDGKSVLTLMSLGTDRYADS
jgi:hypothetical protein